jgi:SH3-like domain-containing protein
MLASLLYLITYLSVFPNLGLSVSAEETTLPLPRFASLRANQVRLRTGPGVQYPIEWVYQRQNLPVEIIAEYRTWRKVRDWESSQGWVHQSMLSGRRTLIVTGKRRSLRSIADAKSPPVAEIEVAAIAHLENCPSGGGWCLIKAGKITGWLRKVEFWGAYRNETLK